MDELKLGPRVVIAGTHSGVGKTTIATGLMAALKQRGLRVRSAKVGPDFIDPGYHSLATGSDPRNLDPWICGPESVAPLAARASAGGEMLVVEGVMGLFDGAVDGTPSSTADVAQLLDAPIILVVDAASMSSSVAALVRGFRDHDPSLRVAGVILNRVGSESHGDILCEALGQIDVAVLGTVYRDETLTWRDRHLGLVPVQEHGEEVVRGIGRLGGIIAASCDLDAIVGVAAGAPEVRTQGPRLPTHVASVRIGVACGAAFSFLYRDNMEALSSAGAEIVPFDPLVDRQLPEGLNGMIVGGGFPEVYAGALADNTPMLNSVRAALLAGLPTWAECGGLLWLCAELDGRLLAGVLNAKATMTSRLTLGYRTADVLADNPVAPSGSTLRGHEFHYTTIDGGVSDGDGPPEGAGIDDPAGQKEQQAALHLRSRFNTRVEGFARPNLLATYLHQHLGGNPAPAERFVRACANYGRIRRFEGEMS